MVVNYMVIMAAKYASVFNNRQTKCGIITTLHSVLCVGFCKGGSQGGGKGVAREPKGVARGARGAKPSHPCYHVKNSAKVQCPPTPKYATDYITVGARRNVALILHALNAECVTEKLSSNQ